MDSKNNKILAPAKGRLLISEPFLNDPHFKRTVILLCDHNEHGSFGFVLNNYIQIDLAEVIQDLNPLKSKVSIGGPVQKDSIFYLHTLGEAIPGSIHVSENIYMGGDFDALKEKINSGEIDNSNFRFFVGYSGWGKDQLAWELKEKSWIVSESTSEQIMNTKYDNLWSQSLRSMGSEFALLANFPSDPNFN